MVPAEVPYPPTDVLVRSLDESETRVRLIEAQLEQAMGGYHDLKTENEALRAQILELQGKQKASVDASAVLERQKRAAARELQNERETIYGRYIDILDNFDRAFDNWLLNADKFNRNSRNTRRKTRSEEGYEHNMNMLKESLAQAGWDE